MLQGLILEQCISARKCWLEQKKIENRRDCTDLPSFIIYFMTCSLLCAYPLSRAQKRCITRQWKSLQNRAFIFGLKLAKWKERVSPTIPDSHTPLNSKAFCSTAKRRIGKWKKMAMFIDADGIQST